MQPLATNVSLFFVFFICSLLLRALTQFSLTFVNIVFLETFIFETRKELFRNIFSNKSGWSYDLGYTSNILGEVIPKAGSFVTSFARFIILLIQAAGLGALCIISLPKEFITSVLIFSLITPLVYILNRKARFYGRLLLDKNTDLNRQIMATVKNLIFIRILGMNQVEEKKTVSLASDYYTHYLRNTKYYALAQIFPPTVGIIIVFLLFYYFNIGGSSGAQLLTLFYLLYRFIQVLGETVAITNGLNMYVVNFKKIMEVLAQNRAITSELPKLTHTSAEKKISHFNLTVQNLQYSYSDGKNVFSNISFNLPDKKCLVIKGPSGCGKSTLLMNLIGMYSPTDGKVIWGNEHLTDLEAENFRRNLGYMGPEPYIISGTIEDNLLYGLHEKPDSHEIEEALKNANMETVLQQLADGLNTKLTEQGEGLSMGQKQRIGLARALLRRPKILVLDEITANLDKETELKIVANIKELKKQMTVLVATHSGAFDSLSDVLIDFSDR